MNWELWYEWKDWYKTPPKERRGIICRLFLLLIRAFWSISDYGRSTGKIILTFIVSAFIFAGIYWLCPVCIMVDRRVGDLRGLWHAIYFSVVTMTTLGFGDIAANPDSWWGQTLLMLQVLLGYVLLAALVTRFAVLFTAGGPAGKFSDEKTRRQRLQKKLFSKKTRRQRFLAVKAFIPWLGKRISETTFGEPLENAQETFTEKPPKNPTKI
jgi:hypothetical protein